MSAVPEVAFLRTSVPKTGMQSAVTARIRQPETNLGGQYFASLAYRPTNTDPNKGLSLRPYEPLSADWLAAHQLAGSAASEMIPKLQPLKSPMSCPAVSFQCLGPAQILRPLVPQSLPLSPLTLDPRRSQRPATTTSTATVTATLTTLGRRNPGLTAPHGALPLEPPNDQQVPSSRDDHPAAKIVQGSTVRSRLQQHAVNWSRAPTATDRLEGS
ncbi:hypothetical protein CKAH01_09845 [Colletotrichum kahawae]|uniref:Uncharacterized protein n=1 Tax=Colletotrichum kahawae TaxID=34407 RepID=A0AAE0CXX5_COLKA|nr:hypothetical protein CKAH01_09845 [Colletotrichum kahawae]